MKRLLVNLFSLMVSPSGPVWSHFKNDQQSWIIESLEPQEIGDLVHGGRGQRSEEIRTRKVKVLQALLSIGYQPHALANLKSGVFYQPEDLTPEEYPSGKVFFSSACPFLS